jgi:hypothetical protein
MVISHTWQQEKPIIVIWLISKHCKLQIRWRILRLRLILAIVLAHCCQVKQIYKKLCLLKNLEYTHY